jgi:hypothetical protein
MFFNKSEQEVYSHVFQKHMNKWTHEHMHTKIEQVPSLKLSFCVFQ